MSGDPRRNQHRSRRRGGNLRRARRGRRLLPLPLRAAARARLPLGGERGLGGGAGQRRLAAGSRPSLLFVASFSTIFILLGLSANGLGSLIRDNEELLTKVSAALIVAMGVLFVLSLFVTRFNREWHVDALLSRAGKGGPIVAGVAFAIAWTPCIGPTLAAILSAAALTGSAGHGAFLLAVYSAGLAIPFLLTALAFSRMT